MNTQKDQELLQYYAESRSETAFAELVRRHVDLVYSAALRMVGDAHQAKDVTQGVFVALSQNARPLASHPVLSGWLHRTAQNLAANAVRANVCRQTREQESVAMNELLAAESETSWEHIAPHLDAALGELSEPDRDAVLLRYFEKKSAQEMAVLLGISDEAAQKRVSRAVERLREFFAKRGVTVGAGGLVVVITANAVQAAPIGLALTIATAALAGTAVTTSTVIAATKTIAMTTLQKTVITAAFIAAAGAGIFEARQAAQLREQNQTLQQSQAPLAEQILQLQRERDVATNRLASMADEIAKIKSNNNELLKLRAEVTRLRNKSQALALLKVKSLGDETESEYQSWFDRVKSLKQRLSETPGAQIPELQYLTEDDWLQSAKRDLKTDDDYRKAFADLRARAEGEFLRTAETALRNFMGTNNGVFPTGLSQLKPYFENLPADEILQRYQIVPANSIPQNGISGDSSGWLITLKSPDSGSLWTLGPNGMSGTSYEDSDTMAILAPALKALMDATPTINGRKNVSMQQLPPYLTTPEQKAAYQKLMQRSNPASK